MRSWITLALSLVACAGGSAPPAAAPGSGVRVVSLHDVTTELVVALGAADQLVGVAEPVEAPADLARAIAGVPRVGDLESIRAVRPAIVVGLAVVAAQDPELVTRLREAGIAVYLAEPRTLDDVFAVTRQVGARIGRGPAGDALAAELASNARAASPPVGGAAGHRPRVFVYDCCDPPFTAGRNTVLSDLIGRAGGDNVFADLAAGWSHVSWEQVVARRPELVVIDAYHLDGQGEVADKQRAVRAIRALAGLPTVVIPLGCSLGGPRALDGLARLRAAIGGPS